MMKLYHAATSVCSQKARLVFAETGTACESVLLDLTKGEHMTPQYRALNPDAVVPTLVHDGLVVRESSLVVEYVDRVAGGGLMPREPLAEVATRLWLVRTLAIHEAVNSMTFATLIREQERARRTPAEIEAWLASTPNPQTAAKRRDLMENGVESVFVDGALHVLLGMLRDMAAALDAGIWLNGSAYSLSDLALTAYVDRLDRLGMAHLWTGRYPAVAAWLSHCRSRPSYATAIESHIPAGAADAGRLAGERAWPAIAARLG
ncbi:glutathione S-transferase family protein [Aquibium sp. ELW1220]|uniref:glutathione S-transferase family protein n=1 Tax=Aquibium sp. ELW1220 TaxID=2976766 RepID=UPI0025B210A0|nr:glutathione S-transferase family protein [Aquibium sp. ELW1220]MDN2580076.1 glutathione S-transferase family protein [Aquibium sp. ELW1220]